MNLYFVNALRLGIGKVGYRFEVGDPECCFRMLVRRIRQHLRAAMVLLGQQQVKEGNE